MSKTITILVGVSALTSVALFLVIVAGQNSLENSSEFEVSGVIGTITAISLLTALLSLAIGIITMIWMFRSTKNVQAIGRTGGTWGPGWAIGGWFCPPCLFVIPWLHLGELWRATSPGPRHDPAWRNQRVSPVVHLWWVLYGLGPILSLVVTFGGSSAGMFASTDVQDAYAGAVFSQLMGTALALGQAASFIKVVRGITERQMALVGA